MKHFADMKFDALELDYGYNISMHVDEECVICECSSHFDGRRYKAVHREEMPSIPFEALNEETMFKCLYNAIHDVQEQMEWTQQGC